MISTYLRWNLSLWTDVQFTVTSIVRSPLLEGHLPNTAINLGLGKGDRIGDVTVNLFSTAFTPQSLFLLLFDLPLKGMLHWRKYTSFTLLCINSIIYLEAICP